jgi:hypothetical protein
VLRGVPEGSEYRPAADALTAKLTALPPLPGDMLPIGSVLREFLG